MKSPLLLILASALALGACGKTGPSGEQAQKSAIGVDLAAMDKSVAAGDDFFQFANGNWVKSNEIPADRTNIGAFFTARQEVERQNAQLIDGILKSNPEAGSNEGRIAAYYRAYTDQAAIDRAGMAPVKADLDRFAAIQDKTQLAEVLGSQVRADVDPFNTTDFQTENLFGIFVTQGLSTPGEVIPYILQGGLSLPDREYYLSPDKEMADIRAAYRPHIEQVLTLAGIPDPAARAQRVYDLELKIARAHATREEANDYAQAATVWSRGDLDKNAPGLDWAKFLAAAQLGNQAKFDAYEPNAIRGLSALVASEPLDAWKDWLIFHQINSPAAVLPSKIDQANFAFFGTKQNGQPQQLSRD
jgi:predicted metalloendopeptidase